MLTFGFSTTIDILSWIVGVALGLKVVATVVLLSVNREVRDQIGWGSALWWTTKVTPVLAAPCLIWIAKLENDAGLARLFFALGLFVAVAVPFKIWRRRRRITGRRSATRPVSL